MRYRLAEEATSPIRCRRAGCWAASCWAAMCITPQLKLADRMISARGGFSLGSGVSLTFKAKEHYGIRFFLDYNLLPSHSRNSGEYMNMLTLGASFMITL